MIPTAPESSSRDFVLVEMLTSVRVGPIAEGLGQVLNFLTAPRTRSELIAKLCESGAEFDECASLILGFIEEGWIKGQLFSPVG